MLTVHTSRIWYSREDRVDITRMSAGPLGLSFAPSWEILNQFKSKRRAAIQRHDFSAVKLAWQEYIKLYRGEMENSKQVHFQNWERLLSRKEAVLVCYCPTAEWCHRGLLADILVETGRAVYAGEIEVSDG